MLCNVMYDILRLQKHRREKLYYVSCPNLIYNLAAILYPFNIWRIVLFAVIVSSQIKQLI